MSDHSLLWGQLSDLLSGLFSMQNVGIAKFLRHSVSCEEYSPCSRRKDPPTWRAEATAYWIINSSFRVGVNDPLGVGPPARGLELLMVPSWPISAKARLNIMIGFLVFALAIELTCSVTVVPPQPGTVRDGIRMKGNLRIYSDGRLVDFQSGMTTYIDSSELKQTTAVPSILALDKEINDIFLSLTEREQIYALKTAGNSIRNIARFFVLHD